MPHVLVAGRIHEAGIDLLKSAKGVSFALVNEISVDSYAGLIGGADAVVIRTQPLTEAVVASALRLRIVSRHGVGYDAVDVDALNRRGIPLTVVGDVNSGAVAEHTLMLMLATARRAIFHDAATRSGNWRLRNNFDSSELEGKVLLVVGFGRIGRKVAKLAAAFGMTVMVHDPFLSEAALRAAGVKPVQNLDSGLGETDVVTLHVPLSPAGFVIGERQLARLKSSAILINTARGGLIDETALDQALRDGRLAGAALDVFAEEPPAPNHPLLSNDRVTLTPHTASLTRECALRMAVASVQNVLDFFEGKLDPALVVNRDHARGLT